MKDTMEKWHDPQGHSLLRTVRDALCGAEALRSDWCFDDGKEPDDDPAVQRYSRLLDMLPYAEHGDIQITLIYEQEGGE